jgi:RHS repeat-associated protein
MKTNILTVHNECLKITGHFLESEGNLGLYHAQARLYDPELPRFYGVDTMRGYYPTINSYQYALNNPIIYTDPTGMYVVQRAYYSATGDVTAKVTIMNQSTVRRFEGVGLALGSLPVVGSGFAGAKMISQGFISQGDPAYRPGAGDYVSLATLGLGRIPKALNTTRKAIWAGVTGANISDAISGRLLTKGVGRDLATFSLIAESSFAGGFVNMGPDGTSLTLNSGLANVISENYGGLSAVEDYLGNFMENVTSIVQAIADGNDLSLTKSEDRQRVVEIYKDNQEIFDYIIGSGLE